MITTKPAKMKINLLNYEYSACLFVYDVIDVEDENDFLTYINEIFKKSKVEKFGARLIVKAPKLQYMHNKIFLQDIYEHKNENHIVIFKKRKLVAYTPLEEVLKIYKNTKAKLD